MARVAHVLSEERSCSERMSSLTLPDENIFIVMPIWIDYGKISWWQPFSCFCYQPPWCAMFNAWDYQWPNQCDWLQVLVPVVKIAFGFCP